MVSKAMRGVGRGNRRLVPGWPSRGSELLASFLADRCPAKVAITRTVRDGGWRLGEPPLVMQRELQ